MSIDFLADADKPVELNEQQMQQLATLAAEQVKIEDWIAKREGELELAKVQLRKIAEVAIPNLMQEIGMSEFTLTNGMKLTIKQEVYASIPADNQQPAFNWLRKTGNDGLIKNVISCQFSKGQDADALTAGRLLAEAGFQPEQKQSVHPMTLKAFIKEQMEKGVDVPLADFGAHTVNKTKIVRP